MSKRIKPLQLQASVWIPDYSALGPQDIKAGVRVGSLSFLAEDATEATWGPMGYTRVGSASISLTPLGQEQMVGNKVESLKALKTKTLADAHAKATLIDEQINNLLALPCA